MCARQSSWGGVHSQTAHRISLALPIRCFVVRIKFDFLCYLIYYAKIRLFVAIINRKRTKSFSFFPSNHPHRPRSSLQSFEFPFFFRKRWQRIFSHFFCGGDGVSDNEPGINMRILYYLIKIRRKKHQKKNKSCEAANEITKFVRTQLQQFTLMAIQTNKKTRERERKKTAGNIDNIMTDERKKKKKNATPNAIIFIVRHQQHSTNERATRSKTTEILRAHQRESERETREEK